MPVIYRFFTGFIYRLQSLLETDIKIGIIHAKKLIIFINYLVAIIRFVVDFPEKTTFHSADFVRIFLCIESVPN